MRRHNLGIALASVAALGLAGAVSVAPQAERAPAVASNRDVTRTAPKSTPTSWARSWGKPNYPRFRPFGVKAYARMSAKKRRVRRARRLGHG